MMADGRYDGRGSHVPMTVDELKAFLESLGQPKN